MVWAMSELREIFDRRVLRHHRDRAAAGIADHDFLFREVAERLLDRLDDVRRRFPLALDLGCHHGVVAELLAGRGRSEEHTSELQSLMRISYAVFCLKKKKKTT